METNESAKQSSLQTQVDLAVRIFSDRMQRGLCAMTTACGPLDVLYGDFCCSKMTSPHPKAPLQADPQGMCCFSLLDCSFYVPIKSANLTFGREDEARNHTYLDKTSNQMDLEDHGICWFLALYSGQPPPIYLSLAYMDVLS